MTAKQVSDTSRAGGIGETKTSLLSQQHAEILATVTAMRPLLASRQTVAAGAAQLRQALMRLGGQLSVHLAMEDKGLYPKLRGHTDPAIASLAAQYETEMGGLKATFVAYSERWLRSAAIGDAPEVFLTETEALFAALGKRIDRENNELYALVDQQPG